MSVISSSTSDRSLKLIVDAYDDPIVRLYCTIRFMILRLRFLDEIGQYLPPSGHVLDVGCGFGLFALHFAIQNPNIHIHGFDLSERRVKMAKRAAGRLGITNVEFQVADAASFRFGSPISAAYMLDLIHHIPEKSVRPLIDTIASNMTAGGRLLVKDVERWPSYKLGFTWALDKLVDFRAPVRYWAPEEIQPLIERAGFVVHRHRMIDYLPYPHILYVSTRHASTG